MTGRITVEAAPLDLSRTWRVSVSLDGAPVTDFTCATEDMPALVDAHIVALIGLDR